MGILASLGDQRPGCGCSSGSDKVLSGNPSAVDAACLHQREDLGLRLFPGEDERLLWEGGFASPALELCRAAGCSAPAACWGLLDLRVLPCSSRPASRDHLLSLLLREGHTPLGLTFT